MAWKVIRTDRFSEEFKKFEKNKEFSEALDKKIKKLKEDPNIGGYLSGKLYGYKSIRLLRKFRILFKINESENKVYLIAIDHRGHVYE
nr:type II toxin-antitoxin system RelE/ParE family toxin [Candidatus Woesearchaeota archaeon]